MSTSGVDLTDLTSVKEYLGEPAPSGTSDTLLAHLITNASAWAQNYMERSIWAGIYTQVKDGTGTQTMMLAEKPVTSVTSVKVNNFTIPQASVLGGTGWSLSDNRIALTGYRFTSGYNNVQIIYTAGYPVSLLVDVISGVPYDLKLAVTKMVALQYKERARLGKTSEGLAGQTTSYLITDLDYDTAQALGNYKKVTPW